MTAPHPRSVLGAAALLVGLLLPGELPAQGRGAGGNAAGAPARSATAGVAPLGPDGLRKAEAALGGGPGRFDAQRRCWAAVVQEDGVTTSGCLRIAKGFLVPGASGAREAHLLLTAKGNDDCHACTGLAAFAVLDAPEGDSTWRVAARPAPARSGSFGVPTDPKDVAFARLGAERWGWIEKTSGFGQGFLSGINRVHLRRGEAVVEAGRLPGDRSNQGACDPADKPPRPGCEVVENITVAASVDVSDPAAAAYPVVLRARGTQGRRRIDKQLVARFDEAQFRYAAPETWP